MADVTANGKAVTVTVRLSPALAAQLDEACARRGWQRVDYVRRCVERALAREGAGRREVEPRWKPKRNPEGPARGRGR